MSKITINSKDLFKAVQLVGACVKAKNTMPVLDNLLFKISDGILTIIADNLEIRTQVEIKVDFVGNTATCIPYKLLTTILQGLPNGPIELSFNDHKVNIKSESGSYNIPIVKAAEFPAPKEMVEAQSIKFNALEFAEALRKAILFTERESVTNFHTIFISISETGTKIASTDGAVIFEYTIDAKGEEKEILLSRDVAKYLIQTISTEEEMEVNYTETHLLLLLENRLITTIQSQGKIPKYDRIFDSLQPNRTLKIDKDVISPAIKRLCGLTDQHNYTLVFNIKNNQLELSFTNSLLKYNAMETMKCEYTGDDIKIGFKASYLSNMIATLDEDIRMELAGADRPCLFFAEKTRAIVGPMKI